MSTIPFEPRAEFLRLEDEKRYRGDSGRGVGASHQTGWTSFVANLLAR